MKTKSQEVKELAGTTRPDRDRAAPRLVAGSTRCPSDLPECGKKWWRKLVPVLAEAGLYTEADQAAARDLVTCLGRLEECEREISEHGILVEGARGGLVRNPAMIAANGYRQAAYRWAAKFGLTPGDRTGLHVVIGDQEEGLAEILSNLTRGGGDE